MLRKRCCICEDNNTLCNIHCLNSVPVKLICTEIPQCDVFPLSFSQCNNCNTIQLDELIPLDILYKGSHNLVSVGNIWKNYFNLFINKIQAIIENKTVLEIGCPSGKIALNSTNYKKWLIVEPNKNDSVFFNEKVIFIDKFFDESFNLNEKVDVITHSHLLEHIYEPNSFLKKCYDLLNNDGDMFFGVPNMDVFEKIDITPFFGMFFEHTVYLNKENILFLLKKNNFIVVDIINYESHSVIYHCKKSIRPSCNLTSHKIENYKESFLNKIKLFREFVDGCNIKISTTDKDVYIFSASYNSQFLISFGLNINRIKGILDNCKEKQGKYLYGYQLKTFYPSILYNNDCIVILKNGCYMNEVLNQIISINSNTEIIS